MRTKQYPSDLTDEQWALVEPLIPVYPGGRPRKTSMRDVLDAIFYILRTCCQWRLLPKDFPPKSTVWGYFDEWRHNGTLERIHDHLRDRVRRKEKPGHPRRSASIDSQSVDASSGGEAIGRDNHKNVNGRKRHIVVDSLGLLLTVVITASGVTEACCKTVFTQRMKQSGMSWEIDSGQAIVDLRVVQLSGVWQMVRQTYLLSKDRPALRTQLRTRKLEVKNAA